MEKDTIIPSKSDAAAGGQHHDIPVSGLAEVYENGVRLNQPA